MRSENAEMKLLLIRHGKVDMEWKKSYTSAEYDKACRQYDEADIVPIGQPQDTGDYMRIYTSSQKRAVQTARQLFPSAPEEMITQTYLLDEVPLHAFMGTKRNLPKYIYDILGRLQWLSGKQQIESRAETVKRADELIALLEGKNENAILVTHGFFMNVLIRRLRYRKRYEVYRGSTFVVSPLEKVKVIDRQPHCGGCHHNCLLEHAGCVIGQDKARKALEKRK